MIEIRKHGRHFAVYEGDVLLAICVYKKGAVNLKERLDSLKTTLRELRATYERTIACESH